jgi:hypothetical protein
MNDGAHPADVWIGKVGDESPVDVAMTEARDEILRCLDVGIDPDVEPLLSAEIGKLRELLSGSDDLEFTVKVRVRAVDEEGLPLPGDSAVISQRITAAYRK